MFLGAGSRPIPVMTSFPKDAPRRRPWILAGAVAWLAFASQAAIQNPRPAKGPSPDTPEFHLARGHEDLKNNRYVQAEGEFRAALALDPRLTVRARFPLAVTLFNLQEREEARKQFEAVRAETGDDPNINYYLGRLDLMQRNLDAAVRNLTIASSKPPFPDTAYYLGYAYLKKSDLTSAEKWLKKAAELAPRDSRVHERLGALYQAMGRKEDADKAFALASELHQQDIVATQQALDCGRSLDTLPLEQARVVCQKLLDREDLGKLVSLGTLYGRHGDYQEALEPFRLAAQLDPDSYEMHYNLGLTCFRLKHYAEARDALQKAVVLRPDVFEVNAPLGAALYALGDDQAAYRVLDHANRLRPENADISRLLSQLALRLAIQTIQQHDTARARQYLVRASQARPDDPEPHRRLAELYEAEGNHAEARRERDQAMRLRSR
jgi:tetratricopeptide (TPR) repeat protein